MVKRALNTALGGVVGGAVGALTESVIESAFGIDLLDGATAIIGATVGAAYVNKDLIERAILQIKLLTGKEPSQLSKDEWERVLDRYPSLVNIFEPMEKALKV